MMKEKEEITRCLNEARLEITRLTKEKSEVKMLLGNALDDCASTKRDFLSFKKNSLEVMERASVEMEGLIKEREEYLKTQKILDETKAELARVMEESSNKNQELVAEISRLNGYIDLRIKEDMNRVRAFESRTEEMMKQISELTDKLKSSEEQNRLVSERREGVANENYANQISEKTHSILIQYGLHHHPTKPPGERESILMDLESVEDIIRKKEEELESLREEIFLMQESEACIKGRDIWTWVSSATTAAAAVTFVAKRLIQ